MRIEYDTIGERQIDDDALYGIHSLRARENFPLLRPVRKEWYAAMGMVKLACYRTYRSFKDEAGKRYPDSAVHIPLIENETIGALIAAAEEVADGKHYAAMICPAIQGGAGTSLNMNVNEIIANRALILTGKKPGEYDAIDPIESANVFQSTNDVVPTALRLALIRQLNTLEAALNRLREQIEAKEGEYRNTPRTAYTQMQRAVPSSYGKLFSGYSDALSRDWWRISKCFERIKTVNLGGSAIGTGIGSPRYFIMEAANELKRISGLPITRAENMSDATANLDAFAEIHGILTAHAVNLEKLSGDIRLLAADAGIGEAAIPPLQAGSSIMPGKVNPVIPEFAISCAHRVYANAGMVTRLCAQGALDLNAYLPAIGDAMLESLEVLIAACDALAQKCIPGICINEEKAQTSAYHNPGICAALLPYIGYHKAGELAAHMNKEGRSIHEANAALDAIDEAILADVLSAENLLRLGYSIKEVIGDGGKE
jgi:aspartate ammonia-lyase